MEAGPQQRLDVGPVSYCGDTCAVNRSADDVAAVSLRCRSWLCPECAERRKAQLISECHRGAPNTFLTLTLRRIPGRTPEQAAKVLARAWRLLRLRTMRHRRLKKLPFGAVMEAHESGFPHLHILLRSIWLDATWLSEQMADIADSPIIKIQRIDNAAKIAGYVAKYAGKAAHKFGTAKRYWFSRDWLIVPRKPHTPIFQRQGRWEREPGSINTFIANWQLIGWRIERLSPRHARATRPGSKKE